MNDNLNPRTCGRCGGSKLPEALVCPSCGWMPGEKSPVFGCLLTSFIVWALIAIAGIIWHLFTMPK